MSTEGVPPTDAAPEPRKGVAAAAASRGGLAVMVGYSVLAPAGWWWLLRPLMRQGDAECWVSDPIRTRQGVVQDCVAVWPMFAAVTALVVLGLWVTTVVAVRRAVCERAASRRATRL